MLLSTIKAYFEEKKELFEGLAMEKLEKEWNVYPVFHIDFKGQNFTKEKTLEKTLLDYISEWEGIYDSSSQELTIGSRSRR